MNYPTTKDKGIQYDIETLLNLREEILITNKSDEKLVNEELLDDIYKTTQIYADKYGFTYNYNEKSNKYKNCRLFLVRLIKHLKKLQ